MERHSNDKTPEEVFENEWHPGEGELVDALAATPHLTEKEALAFVYGHLSGYPMVIDEVDTEMTPVDSLGFEDDSEFEATKETAIEKVEEALWMYELLDAYRSPDLPEDCAECGNALGGRWMQNDDDDPICRDCADIDPEFESHL